MPRKKKSDAPEFTIPEQFGNDWADYEPRLRAKVKLMLEPFQVDGQEGEPGQHIVVLGDQVSILSHEELTAEYQPVKHVP